MFFYMYINLSRLNLENRYSTVGCWSAPNAGLQNSGNLCAYYPEPGMFIPISGIFVPYSLVKGPERGRFLATEDNSGINRLYFSQIDGYRRNSGIFCPYVLRFSQEFLMIVWSSAVLGFCAIK
ncbi:hypothetical protein GNQ08_11720 [Paenibacillus macerans]|uniref:Uncharacterized protein n=3 Tax=Paenibacillus macerans TaxID=44252 RepID=A0A6N8ES13_PAEMA|nr:hypothetical protein [Paenibacillus macerans]MCY7558009.1 hypothetical protein [Paenibacillus macerans]MEC0154436.1 hypothetical protein [Paenibacillus macerans]MUG23076.1 hypothetical protein [Paenibacillus macerans]